MTQRTPIVLNAFNMNCVGHINHGLWTHPRDTSTQYNTLGFGITVNPSTEHPYLLARRFGTLDHLTEGRLGWNIVTGYLDSAARGLGLPQQLQHDDRYDRADEFLEVLYKLLEGSWQDGAVKADKARRVYADPAAVRAVHHQGKHYQVEGVNLTEPSRQRTPVLYQAGTSSRGQAFAARHAEAVFVTGNNKDLVRESVNALRQAAVEAGRKPTDIKIVLGVSVVPGRTEAEAREKDAEYRRYASPEAGLAHFSASTGIDFSKYELDEPVPYGDTNSIQSAVATARRLGWTKRKLLEQYALGGRYPAIVGDAVQVADALQGWVDDTGVDGFNLTRTVVPESFEDFIAIVVPELQSRGLHKTAYAEGSLRHKLFGEGDRLPARHAAARFRDLP